MVADAQVVGTVGVGATRAPPGGDRLCEHQVAVQPFGDPADHGGRFGEQRGLIICQAAVEDFFGRVYGAQ